MTRKSRGTIKIIGLCSATICLGVVILLLAFYVFPGLNRFSNLAAEAESLSKQLTSDGDWNAGSKTNLTVSSGNITINDKSLTELPIDLHQIYLDDNSRVVANVNSSDAPKVVDNDNGTSWKPINTNDYWQIDLGTLYNVYHFKLNIACSYFNGYYSSDGSTWTNFSLFCPAAESYFSPIVSARYFKIVFSNATPWGFESISELRLWQRNPATATHISSPTQIDGSTTLQSWDSFSTTETDHNQHGGDADTAITYEFRSGDGTAGDAGWSSWTTSTDYSGASIDLSALQHDSSHRYLQVRSILTNTDGTSTPTFSDYTVFYTRDDTCDSFDHMDISPTSATLAVGEGAVFTALAKRGDSSTIESATISYSTTGGSIDGSGNYTAPGIAGTYTVTATSSCGGSVDATVTVTEAPIPDPCADFDHITITLSSATVAAGGTVAFSAITYNHNNSVNDQPISFSASGGTISTSGLFTAGSTQGTYTVTATSNCGGSATASITITGDSPPNEWCIPPDYINCADCISKVNVIKPIKGQSNRIGTTLTIKWNTDGTCPALYVDGYEINYKLSLSLDAGLRWKEIARDIKDVNFATRELYQKYVDNGYNFDNLKDNFYYYSIPYDLNFVTSQAKVKVEMYRVDDAINDYVGQASADSDNFNIIGPVAADDCSHSALVFLEPTNLAKQNDGNYSLDFGTLSSTQWGELSLNFAAAVVDPLIYTPGNSNGILTRLSTNDLSIDPPDLAIFADDGSLEIDYGKYLNPGDFSVAARDNVCNRNITAAISAKSKTIDETHNLTLNVPNGGEIWHLGGLYNISWESSYEINFFDHFNLYLSTDSGQNYLYQINNNAIAKTDRAYNWQIPDLDKIVTDHARVKIEGVTSNGEIISDQSNQNFIIDKSVMGAIIDYIDEFAALLAKIFLALATALAGIGAILPSLSNIFSLSTLPEVFYGLLASGKKKRRNWGIIYDINQGLPLPNAKVMLLDAKTNRLIELSVSDREGRYGFIQGEGEYLLKVDKQGYEQLNLSAIDRQSLPYRDNYNGETIKIAGQNEYQINHNLPLKSTAWAAHFSLNVQVLNRISSILYFANWPIIVLGSIFSMLALYISPNVINVAIMLGYLVIWVYQISITRSNRSFGRVFEGDSFRPVDLSLVRVMDSSNKKLVRTAATNHIGHYAMLLKKGSYLIFAQKTGYIQSEAKKIDIQSSLKAVNTEIRLLEDAQPEREERLGFYGSQALSR